MIPLHKLRQLPASQRRRKLVLTLEDIEKDLHDHPESFSGSDSSFSGRCHTAVSYASLVLDDPKLDPEAETQIRSLLEQAGTMMSSFLVVLRLVNVARNALLAAAGTLPGEWNLVQPGDAVAGKASRFFFPSVCVYAEDIRSPFNLGSIFRTAEAFGMERVYVSPVCVPPDHPRACRSAMGCVDLLEWRRCGLDELPSDLPVFALETGGTDISDFIFPESGVVIVGSEELGVSPDALKRATAGRVSIPMTGLKASVNVGVAFGILMQAWTRQLREHGVMPVQTDCSASNPF